MKIRHNAAMAVSLILLAGPVLVLADGLYAGASVGKASLNEDFDVLVVDDDANRK